MTQRVLDINQIPTIAVSNVQIATANSTVQIGALIQQFFTITSSPSGSAGPFTASFPFPFPNACLQCYGNSNGEGPIIINSFNASSVTWYTDFARTGLAATAQYFFAVGH